ncbi:MAG: hypothetical protein A2X49_12660 [Lentisphaerae bacterium GWF2_52_8]|nr:MAG: hypothetical protein A2X49_12660 [Lentisphaerae bacterium GWF2_52_8]
MRNYANAKDVLPEELLVEIKKHFRGMLYIPTDDDQSERRKKLVMALNEHGLKAKEVAAIAGISDRRVNQIIAESRKAPQSQERPKTRFEPILPREEAKPSLSSRTLRTCGQALLDTLERQNKNLSIGA